MNKDVCVIVPAYNEANMIGRVLADLLKNFSNIVVIDDGSSDDTAKVVKKHKVMLISHAINLGQGAALQTGLSFVSSISGIKYFLTFDADGQHNVSDALKLVKVIKKGKADIVFGSRFYTKQPNMPKSKFILLKTATKFTNLISGVKMSDAHNGLRIFNLEVASNLNITLPGMAHASEIIDQVSRHNWRYQEVPITVNYNDYSKAKGQSPMNSVNIAVDLLVNRFNR